MQEKDREISIIKKRILEYLDYKGISKYEFYQKTGISNGILSQKNGLSEENLLRFLNYFGEISPEWLVTGSGEMLRNDVPVSKPTETGEGIPLIPIEAVAGWNGIDTPGVTLIDCASYHIPDFISAGAEYLIRVSGSSMYPKYSSGDIFACKKIHEITFFQWGKIYVIDSAQGTMVKRLFECQNQPNNIICKSDNEKYPPFELPKAEIRSLSIVIGVVRLE